MTCSCNRDWAKNGGSSKFCEMALDNPSLTKIGTFPNNQTNEYKLYHSPSPRIIFYSMKDIVILSLYVELKLL